MYRDTTKERWLKENKKKQSGWRRKEPEEDWILTGCGELNIPHTDVHKTTLDN